MRDRDRDGLPDEWAVNHQLDSRNAFDAAEDQDGDGYTNLEEYINGTDLARFVDYRNPERNWDPRRAPPVRNAAARP